MLVLEIAFGIVLGFLFIKYADIFLRMLLIGVALLILLFLGALFISYADTESGKASIDLGIQFLGGVILLALAYEYLDKLYRYIRSNKFMEDLRNFPSNLKNGTKEFFIGLIKGSIFFIAVSFVFVSIYILSH